MNNKHWLVVGGNSGIGAALVQRLRKRDESIWCLSRHIESANIKGINVKNWDVMKEPFPENFAPKTLDGVVYCPGSIRLKPFTQLTERDFNEDFQLNVLGAVKTLQACHNALSRADHASVVLFSTVAVQTGLKFHASVASAKGALEGLTRSLASEWAPKISVNAIAPALIETPLSKNLINDDKRRQAVAQMSPMKCIGQPDTIAQLAEWLLTMPQPFVSGQVFAVDGGLSSLRV